MIVNDLISSLINCARDAVNDFHLHFDNRADGVKNEIGYITIEKPSNLVGYTCLIFDQVDSTLRNLLYAPLRVVSELEQCI